MHADVTDVVVLDGYRLLVRFEDGAEGEVDLSEFVKFVGVFAPLKDRSEFVKVRVDAELGTVCWPSGADLDPLVLYCRATGQPLPDWAK